MIIDNISYSWINGPLVQDELLKELSELYSHHYGVWSQYKSNGAGNPIKLSPRKLQAWLESPDSAVYYATCNQKIIGYAIAIRKRARRCGTVSWVTQLVVHTEYRDRGIAKRLLFSIWGLSNDFAWGILSANPYAIRALEKATRRRSIPMRIKKHIRKLMEIGSESLPYIKEDTEYIVDGCVSRVNTEFFVDHADIPNMLSHVITEGLSWTLGDLPEGWEWIAFTFQDQKQFSLSTSEIEEMIVASDDIAKQAYARMDATYQPWMRYTFEEVQFIIRECGLTPGKRLIDFGCGIGRHSNALAEYGIHVTGVDYVDVNIKKARKNASKVTNVEFLVDDCRTVSLEPCDAAICLYDVVGSYALLESNQSIINNIAKHLKPQGIAIISVMNYELTDSIAKYRFSFSREPNKLLDLLPSTTMERTGNVFRPDYFMVDEDDHIVYRREQFTIGQDLPKELLVRDRRFTMSEIKTMCEKAGLEVVFARYVNASNWEKSLGAIDPGAKEILLKCRKISYS